MRRRIEKQIIVMMVLMTGFAVQAKAEKPNIILIMPDDIGYGDYSCFGNPISKTPEIDSLKDQSLLFTQFHVSPKCGPTRAALMSGAHEFRSGVTHTILERDLMNLNVVTLPETLKTAGYSNGIFGKWHLGDEEAYRPENRGFDEVYIHGGGGIGQTYPGSCGDAPNNSNINPALWHNGTWVKTEGYCTDLFFDQAATWMKEKSKKKEPFFAYIAPNAAHLPHVLPEEYYQHLLNKEEVKESWVKFYGMVENIDMNVGKLMATLDTLGIADNTILIYIGGDNGATVGKQVHNCGMSGRKGSPYQGGSRVPLFVRWPAGGVPAGQETARLTAHMDLFPTLAEIAGVKNSDPVKAQLEGRSMVPLFKNPQAEWADRMLIHHVGSWPVGTAAESKYAGCAIQNSRFTLVNNELLYDLLVDPGEKKDVAAQYPEVVAQFRKTYDQFWNGVQKDFINEDVVGPEMNPMKVLYWKQFGGEPDATTLRRMDPTRKFNTDTAKKKDKKRR